MKVSRDFVPKMQMEMFAQLLLQTFLSKYYAEVTQVKDGYNTRQTQFS